MKTLMRDNNDGRFSGNGIVVETHISGEYGSYDVYFEIEREIDDGNKENTTRLESCIAETKKQAQRYVTYAAKKLINSGRSNVKL